MLDAIFIVKVAILTEKVVEYTVANATCKDVFAIYNDKFGIFIYAFAIYNDESGIFIYGFAIYNDESGIFIYNDGSYNYKVGNFYDPVGIFLNTGAVSLTNYWSSS